VTPKSDRPNPILCQLIAERIAAAPQQRITFAEYMDLVLYHPQQGYYATAASKIGAQGDFFTSPHLGADFGRLLAEQFVQMWEILEHPTPFTLVEMGAGQGLIAADILNHLKTDHPEVFNAVEYIIVEKAAGMIAQQQQVLERLGSRGAEEPGSRGAGEPGSRGAGEQGSRGAEEQGSRGAEEQQIQDLGLSSPITNHQFPKLRWCSLEEIPDASIVGCCFSNELVDALPVHQFVLENGQLREVYITATETGQFVEVTAEPSTSKLAEYFELVGIDITSADYPEGFRSEVNLAALDWLSTVAQRLDRGYLLTIDYGYTAVRYYTPQRYQGTLQCYYRHQYHNDPYWNIGHQDLTAHVDFTALERQGDRCGLQTVGFTKQGMFLMALGLGDRIAALSSPESDRAQQVATAQDLMAIMGRREALHQLIDPSGLGGFGVLIQSKGLTLGQQAQALKGLSMPPM
jgi:SAM-dependent MidA family methyltransferase